MTKKHSTKRSLIASLLVLCLCLSSLIGTTFAWFTDSVTSSGNIIKSGTLDVSMLWADGTKSVPADKAGWTDASTGAIFNNDKWEPGYTEAKHVKISNDGTLALKYAIRFMPDGDVSKLADVIDVYYADPAIQVTERTALTEDMKIGTLAEVIEGMGATATGSLKATESHTVTLVLKMRETADNEYQDKSIGSKFSIQLVATQETYESDSLDDLYDKDASLEWTAIASAADLASAIKNGQKNLVLSNDIVLSNDADDSTIDALIISGEVHIDGNGYSITRTASASTFSLSAATPSPLLSDLIIVEEGAKLTLTDVTVDGGAIWSGDVDATLGRGTENTGLTATGALILAKNNASITLGEGAVIQNNCGAYAINLGTRIGATLTIDGGEVINNNSEAGAIWGGGHITMNSGKISNNSSTGIAGAIRMVSNCNLTITGGEMNNNKAAGDGGAIWGYGSSTYTFSGGEMSGNSSSGTGGAIYTGTYSKLYVSGDFEMCNNSAANSGAIRLTDHSSLEMTGGKISGNTQNGESNAFNTWNNYMVLTSGVIDDDISYVGGLDLHVGASEINGIIAYNLSTNHNTAYLKADFNGFKFTVNESAANFSQFNFKPAADYTYTEGDEDKLVCMNEGYETYWDAAAGLFKLQAK